MEIEPEIEILFSGGAYALPYQSGFARYLLDLLGKEFLSKC